MKNYDEQIGLELQRLRESKGLSLMDVSRLVGKSKYTLHGYEKGRNSISASMLLELLEIYDEDANAFIARIK
jgi:transcriptional regulator with XRE-family HTH domain